MTPEKQAARAERVRILRRRSDYIYIVIMIALLLMVAMNRIINYQQEQTIKHRGKIIAGLESRIVTLEARLNHLPAEDIKWK